MLGPLSQKIVGESLLQLLTSDDEIVVNAIYRHLSEILLTFAQCDTIKQQVFLETLFNIILETRKLFEETPSIGWRLHERILKVYEVFPVVFDSDIVFENCIQPLCKLLIDVGGFVSHISHTLSLLRSK
jgi:hypothetical protein